MPTNESVEAAQRIAVEFENELRAEAGVSPKYIPHAVSCQDALYVATKDLDRRRAGEIVGLPWPPEWSALGSRLGPIEPASLTIIAARPSVGKTIFGLQLARFLGSKGKRVLFVSRELSLVRIMRRNWAAYGAYMRNLQNGEPSEQDIKAIGNFAHDSKAWQVRYDDFSKSVEEIRSEAAEMMADIIIIDYLQRLAYDTEKEYAAITRIANELQDVTLETEIPIVCLSQLSRPVKGQEMKAPSMSDTRGSGAVEERAANLVLLHRHWESEEQERYGKMVKVGTVPTDTGWFIVAKCADGESGRMISVRFNGARMTIIENLQ